MGNFVNHKDDSNGGGFTLSNIIINTALAIIGGSFTTAGAITGASLAVATNVLATASGRVGIGIASSMQAKLHVHDSTTAAHLYVSSFAPSMQLANHAVLASGTMFALVALATGAGNYGLPNAGDVMLAAHGTSHGDIYVNPNYTGSGKSTILVGPSIRMPNLGSYANDAAAAAGGVVVGGLYRNGSVMMFRVV